jgi:hypothetical protein
MTGDSIVGLSFRANASHDSTLSLGNAVVTVVVTVVGPARSSLIVADRSDSARDTAAGLLVITGHSVVELSSRATASFVSSVSHGNAVVIRLGQPATSLAVGALVASVVDFVAAVASLATTPDCAAAVFSSATTGSFVSIASLDSAVLTSLSSSAR